MKNYYLLVAVKSNFSLYIDIEARGSINRNDVGSHHGHMGIT
jgi:hypothetical protein